MPVFLCLKGMLEVLNVFARLYIIFKKWNLKKAGITYPYIGYMYVVTDQVFPGAFAAGIPPVIRVGIANGLPIIPEMNLPGKKDLPGFACSMD